MVYHRKSHTYSGRTFYFVVVLLIILLFCVSGCTSDDDYRNSETEKFENQLGKDPSEWTKEEQDRYNDYIDWLGKQEND